MLSLLKLDRTEFVFVRTNFSIQRSFVCGPLRSHLSSRHCSSACVDYDLTFEPTTCSMHGNDYIFQPSFLREVRCLKYFSLPLAFGYMYQLLCLIGLKTLSFCARADFTFLFNKKPANRFLFHLDLSKSISSTACSCSDTVLERLNFFGIENESLNIRQLYLFW